MSQLGMLHLAAFAVIGLGSCGIAFIRFRPSWKATAVTIGPSVAVSELAGWLDVALVRPYEVSSGQSLVVAFLASLFVTSLAFARARSEELPSSRSGNDGPGLNIKPVPALDGLRGLAILMVLIGHSWWITQPLTRFDAALSFWALLGWSGVELFFVLSGYLITATLMSAKARPNYFRNFYARRVLRIFPAYYAVLFVTFVLWPLLFATSVDAETVRNQAWFWLYASNYWMALHHGFTSAPTLGITWSLAVEEQFYLLWPPIVFLLNRRWLIRICAAMVVGALTWRSGAILAHWNSLDIYVVLPSQMDMLAIGAAIAVLGPEALPRLRRVAPTVLAVSICGVVGIGASSMTTSYAFYYGDRLMESLGFSLIALGYGAALILAVGNGQRSWWTQLLEWSAFRVAGRYSYAMYLLHRAVLVVLAAAMGGVLSSVAARLGTAAPGQLAFTLSFILATAAVAWVSWHYWEQPFLSLKRYFATSKSRPAEPSKQPDVLPARA